MSPNSRAQAEKTASGSWLAKGILPKIKCGLGPGGRLLIFRVIDEDPVYRLPKPAFQDPKSARSGGCLTRPANRISTYQPNSIQKNLTSEPPDKQTGPCLAENFTASRFLRWYASA